MTRARAACAAPHSRQAAALASAFKLRTKSTIIGLTSSGASSCGQWPTPGRPTTLRTLRKRSRARTRAGGVHGSASPKQICTAACSLWSSSNGSGRGPAE